MTIKIDLGNVIKYILIYLMYTLHLQNLYLYLQ